VKSSGVREPSGTSPRWRVTLKLGSPFPPHVTTGRLGIEPSRGYLSRDEVRYQLENGEWGPGPWWVWELDSRRPIFDALDEVGVTGLESHIQDILTQLYSHWDDVLEAISERYVVTLVAILPLAHKYLNSDGEVETGRPNAEFLPFWEDLKALGELKADLEVTYVLPGSGKL